MINQALELVSQFKRGLAARRRVETDFLGLSSHDTGETFMGYKIIHWEDLCTSTTGTQDPMALVAAGRPYIYTNAGLLALPKEVREGVFAHEVGHIKLEHRPSPTYMLEAFFGFGSGLELEYAADAFAIEHGYKPQLYLERVYSQGFKSRAIRKRLNRITELNAV